LNRSVEIDDILHKHISDYDTSTTVKISHYTFKTTSIKTGKTLLDKTRLHQRDE